MSKDKNKFYIKYNSLVTLSILSQEYENSNLGKYLVTEENLEHSLNFKLCKKPLLEYSDLKESLFYLRKIDECISNYGISDNGTLKKNKKENNMAKELGFLSRESIRQNNHFYLQHMVSKKFVCVEKTQDNKFVLKLMKNIENAATFLLIKINKKRNSKDFLSTKEIFYLALYIKVEEEDVFYYIQDDKNPINKNKNIYYNIIIAKKPITKFFLINQMWNTEDTKSIYSGQLINIIFSYTKENQEEQYMLSVEKKENLNNQNQNFEILNYNIEEEKKEKIDNNSEYRIIGIKYCNELCEHVLNNSFWVIEEKLDYFINSNKTPIQIKEHIRIKNLYTGLYLCIHYNDDNEEINSKLDDSSFSFTENKTYFKLVPEEALNKNPFFEYNFLFFNYMLDSYCSEIIDDGKYILKGVFRKLKINRLNRLEYYYQSISINIGNKNNNLIVKSEDDFIFKIKKIDVNLGNQVIYVKKIISILEQEINNKNLVNNDIINDSIRFFFEYLLNIDYSYRDENYEYNVPIRERQNLLLKFNIVETVANLIDGYLNIISEDEKFLSENMKEILNELLTNIIKFFKYLSVDNEEIKQTIYIVALNKLLNFAEKILEDDITILINFIFDLIDNSEALQDYLLGGGGLLKQQIIKNKNLSKYNNNDFLRENKLMEYIEKNHNYLLCYEKLIELNKVQYKRKEIISHVKKHMEEIKNNYNLYNKNYKQRIEEVVSEVIKLIIKHAILMERFKKEEEKSFFENDNNEKLEEKKLYGKKHSTQEKNNNKDNEGLKSKKTQFPLKSSFLDSSKNSSLRPFLESRKDNNIQINNKESDIIENNNKFKNLKTLFTFSSINKLDDNLNNNNLNKNLISEVSDSVRLLKESVNIDNKISKNDEINIIEPKTTKLLNTNLFSSILKKKTKKFDKNKGDPFDSKETLKSDKMEPYQKYLNKLGKICIFIKFFTAFDLDNSLFVQDNFLIDVFKEGIKLEEFENQLYLFYVGNFSQEGSNNIVRENNFIILYLFHLYNMLFPSIKSKIKLILKENRSVTGMDIVNEIKNDLDYNDYSEIDEKRYKEIMKDDFEKLDQDLCILYSIYQFCINQYVKTIYVLSSITSNYFMNFSTTEILEKFKSSFIDTIKHLLSNVVFMKNEVMEKQYSQLMENPSLLNRRFISEILLSNQTTINDKIKNKNNNNKKKSKNKQFSNKEAILIEYLFYFENKCDQIKYLYERISAYRFIKNLMNDEESEDKYKIEQLKKILELLNIKKSQILKLYEELVNINTTYTLAQNKTTKYIDEDEEDTNKEEIQNNNFVIFKVSKRTEIIIKLLRKYELDKFFKNIIYLESQESNLKSNKSIKKIRKIREHLYQIENEIQKIKINLGKDINLSETVIKSLNYGEPNRNAFMSLNRHLSQICNESGQLFNLNSIVNKRKDKICQMLSMENKNFYEKIKFIKTFKCLIEAINYYKGEKDQSILLYCSYLLKIFNDLKNIDNKFHKNIVENYEIYSSLILKSLSTISEYPIDKIGEKEQYFFLNLCYYGMSAFLLILKNCKKCFKDMSEFMQNIFKEMKIIFNKFQNGKYKIVFQILYTYAVTRVLLFLNKNKTYDSYSYNNFYNFIYPTDEMRQNISFCVKTINNNSKKEHIISRRNTDIFDNKNSDNEEENEAFSLYIPDDENDPLIDRDLKAKIIPMDLSNVMNLNESKHTQEKAIIFKEEVKNEKTAYIDFIRWEDEDELNRLSFYLNFLSIYVIYLNDKNSLLQNAEEFDKKENNEKENFSFNSLSSKIKSLLDSNYNNNNNPQEEANNLISSQMESTLIKEEKIYFGEYLGSKNIDYKFHSVLLESILNYREKFKGKNIEIPIFKVKNHEDNELQKSQTQVDDLLVGKENNNIVFYYYSPQFIDIILIEKIVNDIELKKDLMTYCIEEYNSGKNNPPLLEKFFEDKKQYKLIENYYDEEFNLIHNHFIKNNMELLIKGILNNYNSNDLTQIEEMENYIFKRMGEIYSDNEMRNEENNPKNNSLIEEFISLNEENIKPDLNQINILAFFKSLVYIYPKFKKSIGIIYYKIGFKLLINKLQKNNQSNDIEEDIFTDFLKFDLYSITNILILLFSRKINKELIEDKKVFPTMLKSITIYFDYILNKGGGFIFKNIELLKELFHRLDFIFEYLSQDFEKISILMKKQYNKKGDIKFQKKKERLKNLLDFLISFLEFKNKTEENLLTEEIFEFTSKVIAKIIGLLTILLEIPNERNFEIINILLDFLFNFIKGPDVENLNLLFSLGYFRLVSFVIKNIDYYDIFLNFIKKDNMHDAINKLTEIECKIIKIFIIYYNESHGNNNNSVVEFEKLQHWYEDNFKYIRSKLKKIYYMSQKEMEGKEYDINKMLLFMKDNDDYDEFELSSRGGISEIGIDIKNENIIKKEKLDKKMSENINENLNNKYNQKIKEKKHFCIIKFDLLLSYYSLYNYHKDLANKDRVNCLISKTVLHKIIGFFIDFFIFLLKLASIIFIIIYYFVKKLSSNKKDDVDLLQELTNIEFKSQLINDQKMINFLRIYIRELEVTINNTIYKIYFPMIDKSNTIEQYKEEYYKVDKIDSSDFINYILSNYDKINIRANQYVMINKIINLPVINIFFKKIYIYFVLLIILGTISNILIMLSYSIFNDKCNENDEKEYTEEYIRLRCPHFLYEMEHKSSSILDALAAFGFIEFILQCLIFIDYIVRIFFVEQGICKLNCKIKRLKESKSIKNIDCYTFFYEIILKTIVKCIINFRSIYYILSICFIILGLKVHPFFNCITLLEFVNRIQLMQTVLKAMYKPLKNILITLLMFIIIEYFFSLLAVSFFTTHYPNETDTKNFLKTFMRMMDQTFKQDGGIGTYLNKSLEEGYVPYSVKSYFNVRFFFDLLFFLLILLIIFQMFLSTIIDYFNETRENTEDFQKGLETKCIVCGMEREKIEKIYSHDKNAFDNHVNYYHNAFNYVYYLMFLQSSAQKDPIIEKNIWDIHLKKDLSYLPKNECFKENEEESWRKLNQRKNEEENEN